MKNMQRNKKPPLPLRGQHYVLGTLYNHPHKKSIEHGIRKRGGTLAAQADIVEALTKKNSPLKTFSAIIVPAAEKKSELAYLSYLLHAPRIAELDFAGKLLKSPIIAVSGTDGKTSTADMIAHILRDQMGTSHVEAHINFESSIMESELSAKKFPRTIVAEVYSSQLESCESFHPKIACLTNLAPDHFDQHGSWREYRRAKANLFRYQTKQDFLLINAKDKNSLALVREVEPRSKIFYFSTSRLPTSMENGLFWHDGSLWIKSKKKERCVAKQVGDFDMFSDGEHFASNRLCALLVAHLLQLSIPKACQTIARYRKRPYRQEMMRNISSDWLIVNDSKATSPHAAISALQRFRHVQPFIWITGGTDKGLPLRDVRHQAKRAKAHVILMRPYKALRDAFPKAMTARSMTDAIAKAQQLMRRLRQPGVILFSPIGASEDLYEDYLQRGQAFTREIRTKMRF